MTTRTTRTLCLILLLATASLKAQVTFERLLRADGSRRTG